jgi:hypothetical protein
VKQRINPKLLERRIHVLVAGCGGNGSLIVFGLSYPRHALFKAATAAHGHDRLAIDFPELRLIGEAAPTLRDNLFRPGQECIDAFLTLSYSWPFKGPEEQKP